MRHAVLMSKKRFLEVRNVKKVSLIFVLTLVLLCAFAAIALAGSGPHGDYTADTDACGTCHGVHKTNDRSTLLHWNDATEACLYCHNGTISKYNVVKGELTDNGQKAPSHGGLFATKNDGANATAYSASQHDVFNSYSILVNSAPGGKGSSGADVYGSWSSTDVLTCGSCHEPHGAGGNPRLLNPNPNGTQNLPVNQVKNVQLGSTQFADVTSTPTFYFKDGKTGATAVTDGSTPPKNITNLSNKLRPILSDLSNAPIKVYVGGNLVTVDKYIIGSDNNGAYVKFVANPGPTGYVTVDYTAGVQVVMNITNKGTVNEAIVYGNGMQEFCATCHTDYAGSRSSSTAVYDTTNPYHHSGNRANSSGGVTFPQLGGYTGKVAGTGDGVAGVNASVGSCLTCHYSHGVDQTVWKKAAEVTGIAVYDTPEISGSSALKRLPNMGTCEVCHKWGAKSYSTSNQFVLRVNPLDPTKGLAWQNPKPNP